MAMITVGCPGVGSALGLVISTYNRNGYRAPRDGNFGRAVGRVARDALVIMITITKIHIDEVIVHRGVGRKVTAESVSDQVNDARSQFNRST
jgi:hypothetical protein